MMKHSINPYFYITISGGHVWTLYLTNQPIKSQRISKRYYKTFGTSVINSLSPSFLTLFRFKTLVVMYQNNF